MTRDRHDCFNADVQWPSREQSIAQLFAKKELQWRAGSRRSGRSGPGLLALLMRDLPQNESIWRAAAAIVAKFVA